MVEVEAVTGAGYSYKYLHNVSQDCEDSSGFHSGGSVAEEPESSSLFGKMRDFSAEKSAGRAEQKPSFHRGSGRFQERTPCNSPVSAEMASSSGVGSGYFANSSDISEAFTCGADIMKGYRKNLSSLRSRRSNLHHLKPLSSLESCLMAQLYKKHAEMEEHVLAPLPSPCTPALRPFLVTDSTLIISRSSCDSVNVHVRDGKGKSHIKVYPEANDTVFGGIPHLPEIRSEEGSKEKNVKRRTDQNRKLSSSRRMHNEMQISSQQGSTTGAVLFCLGVSVGIISSILANKDEVAKLHDLLKQTESLVQDLQEELEMKDSVTVKELVNEDDGFPYANESSANKKTPNEPLVPSVSGVLIEYGVETSDPQKATETMESMSTIEAELEAELERMELNMKKSTLNGMLSDDDDEFDPDFVAEVVRGELRADIVSGKPSSEPSFDHSSSSGSTPCSLKQAVSPRELSLRLHQVIQSRLEERVMELEAALEGSEKRILQLQLGCSSTHTDLSSSSFSTRGSPATIGGSTPLVMRLSGEAIDAYNGACQEPKKINESEIEKQNSETYRASQGEQLFNGSLIAKQNGTENDLTPVAGSRRIEQLHKLCEDENGDKDDDMTLLIKQIVEKTRQGSPAVLHAHRAMFYLDKNSD